MSHQMICANAVEWARQYAEEIRAGRAKPFHAGGGDAPYHMVATAKRFGKASSAPAKPGRDGAFARLSHGFMGEDWDGAGEDGSFVAFDVETWKAFGSVMYRGGLFYAYASAKDYWRMAAAMDQAGWVLLPSIFCWTYVSGFPKVTRIDLQADRDEGVQPRKVGTVKHRRKFAAREFGHPAKDNGYNDPDRETYDLLLPSSPLGQDWYDYFYGGQPLKPAVEPILMAYWPRGRRPIADILTTGAGALNIGGVRDWTNGKWPANLSLVHHPACGETCHPECVVQAYRAQYAGHDLGALDCIPTFDWSWEVIERLDQEGLVRYCPKPTRAEKEAGLDAFPDLTVSDGREKPIDNPYQRGKTTRKLPHATPKPLSMAYWLGKLLLPPDRYGPRRFFNPFMGTGTESIGAQQAGFEQVFGIELKPKYLPYAEARAAYWRDRGAPTANVPVQAEVETDDLQPSMFEE